MKYLNSKSLDGIKVRQRQKAKEINFESVKIKLLFSSVVINEIIRLIYAVIAYRIIGML